MNVDFEIEGMKFCPDCRRFKKNYGIPQLTGNGWGYSPEQDICDSCYDDEKLEDEAMKDE